MRPRLWLVLGSAVLALGFAGCSSNDDDDASSSPEPTIPVTTYHLLEGSYAFPPTCPGESGCMNGLQFLPDLPPLTFHSNGDTWTIDWLTKPSAFTGTFDGNEGQFTGGMDLAVGDCVLHLEGTLDATLTADDAFDLTFKLSSVDNGDDSCPLMGTLFGMEGSTTRDWTSTGQMILTPPVTPRDDIQALVAWPPVSVPAEPVYQLEAGSYSFTLIESGGSGACLMLFNSFQLPHEVSVDEDGNYTMGWLGNSVPLEGAFDGNVGTFEGAGDIKVQGCTLHFSTNLGVWLTSTRAFTYYQDMYLENGGEPDCAALEPLLSVDWTLRSAVQATGQMERSQ